MKSVKSALLLATFATALVSCSDSDDVNNEVKSPLEGNYTFVDMKADTHEEVESHYSDEATVLKTISNFAYDAENLKGTVSIDASKFASSKISYSIKGTLFSKTYMDGELFGETDQPYGMDIPEASGTNAYKLIGTDSIYFESGFVNSPALGDAESAASGAKFKWEGDTLVIDSEFRNRDTTVEKTGDRTVTTYYDQYSHQIMRLKKN